MQELAKMIAQALVDEPDQVNVTISASGHTMILNLRVGQGDAGKIIGKQGRTVSAFRTILNAVAAKEKKRVILEISDDRSQMGRPANKINNTNTGAAALGWSGKWDFTRSCPLHEPA
jgi:hypothetical protein